MIRVVLDDPVEKLVVADARAERPVAKIVARLQQVIVGDALDRGREVRMRRVERLEGGLPARGRRIADVRIVPGGRLRSGLASGAPRHFVAPAMEDEFPDRGLRSRSEAMGTRHA